MSNERYTKNRNLWKKVYPATKQKPKFQEFVANQITYSINLESFQRERNLFRIHPDYGQYQTFSIAPVIPPVIWEDGKFIITSASPNLEYTFNFNQTFSNPPIVSLGINAGTTSNPNMLSPYAIDINYGGLSYDSYTVNIVGIGSPTTNSITFRTSAPYTGSIHYFAFDSNVATNVTVNPNYWYPGTYQASGGKITASLTQSLCAAHLTWDPITVVADSQFVYVTMMTYLPNGTGPVIRPKQNFDIGNDYGPFYQWPLTLSADNVNFSTSGSVVLHYIAIALSGSVALPPIG